jgi:hypothetical protein
MATTTENVSEEQPKEEVVQPQQMKEENISSQNAQEEVSKKSEENNKEYNFRKMRETLEQRDEEIRMLRERDNNSNEDELGEEDLVEGKHLKRGLSEIKDIIRKKELESVPDKLKSKFEDFNDVVTKENLEKLQKTEPELFQTLQVEDGKKLSAGDLFVKGIAAYKTIKSLKISPENQEYMNKKEHIQSNHDKPMSVQAINGAGAIHQANAFANGLTPELKKQLNKEMVESIKAR